MKRNSRQVFEDGDGRAAAPSRREFETRKVGDKAGEMAGNTRYLRFAFFAAAGIFFFASLGGTFLISHSELAPEKMWACFQRPACLTEFLHGVYVGCLAAGIALLGIDHLRRYVGWRRRAAIAGITASALVSLVAFAWSSRPLEVLFAARGISSRLGLATPSEAIKVLDFRYHHSTLVDGPSFEACVELASGNVGAITNGLRPAAIGDDAEALRMARETFPWFTPNPDGAVLSIRKGVEYEGWIVPGASPTQFAIFAWLESRVIYCNKCHERAGEGGNHLLQ